jgi:hypothetical protein
MSGWDAIDALKKTLPETPKQRREREAQETLAAWREWFKTAGARLDGAEIHAAPDVVRQFGVAVTSVHGLPVIEDVDVPPGEFCIIQRRREGGA